MSGQVVTQSFREGKHPNSANGRFSMGDVGHGQQPVDDGILHSERELLIHLGENNFLTKSD